MSTPTRPVLADTEDARPPRPPKHPMGSAWSPMRIVGVVVGSVLVLQSLGLLLGGAGTLWVDQGLRDDAGYLTSQTESINSDGYALITENISIETGGVDVPDAIMGEVRIRVTGSDDEPLFVGVAPTGQVAEYLADVQTTTLIDLEDGDYRQNDGGAPAGPPAREGFWAVQTSGAGTQSLEWDVDDGDWTVVVMNSDAAADVDARADIGATVPFLGWLAAGLLVGGAVLLLVGIVLLVVSIPRSGQRPATP